MRPITSLTTLLLASTLLGHSPAVAQQPAPPAFPDLALPSAEVTPQEAYVRAVARQAYVWGWPMVNMLNRRARITQAPHPGLLGGVLPATEDRLGAIARTGIPYVGSVGALDMVNFWAPDTVPAHYAGRTLYKHNPNVTLMRTSAKECAQIGAWIGERLNSCNGPVRFLIPEKGVSALDIEGGAFFDADADAALFEAIEATVEQTDRRRIIRLPLHINDPEFAEAAVAAFKEIA